MIILLTLLLLDKRHGCHCVPEVSLSLQSARLLKQSQHNSDINTAGPEGAYSTMNSRALVVKYHQAQLSMVLLIK